MLLKISSLLTNYFIKKKIIDTSKKEIMLYGFQLTLSTLASSLSILLISASSNVIYGIIFLIYFMPIRFFLGGYHATSYARCFLYTNTCYIVTHILNHLVCAYRNTIVETIWSFGIFLYLLLCEPCQHTNNLLNDLEITRNRSNASKLLVLYLCIMLITIFSYEPMYIFELNTLTIVTYLHILGLLRK